MSTRLTIHVDDDIPTKLLELANGQRKQGDFISNLVRAAWSNQSVAPGATLDGLRLQVIGLIAELQELKGRMAALEGKISRVNIR
jgi:predicted transcriptional regulator